MFQLSLPITPQRLCRRSYPSLPNQEGSHQATGIKAICSSFFIVLDAPCNLTLYSPHFVSIRNMLGNPNWYSPIGHETRGASSAYEDSATRKRRTSHEYLSHPATVCLCEVPFANPLPEGLSRCGLAEDGLNSANVEHAPDLLHDLICYSKHRNFPFDHCEPITYFTILRPVRNLLFAP